MTAPSSNMEQLRPDLGDTLQEFDLQADQAGFVGMKIAPVLEVDVQADVYGKIELKEMLKSRDTARADDGSYKSGSGKGTTDNYSTEEHGFEERVDKREAKRFGSYWNAELLAASRTRDAVLRNHNERVINTALGVTNTNAAGTAWTDTGSADPIGNIRAGKFATRIRTGLVPNKMVIGYERLEYLLDCDSIIERIKYSGRDEVKRGQISLDMLASIFGLDEVIVAGAVMNAANEAQQASISSMWDETKALLFVDNSSDDLKKPQFMRTIHWGADGSSIGAVVESYYDPGRRSDMIRSRMDTDEKVIYAEAAQIITGV